MPNILGSSFTAGKFGNASGITVNDIDFEDLNQDGQKDSNEQSQTILMTIVSDGGKIGLDDPNDNASNTTAVVVDIFEDERGANILGKSSAINTVLSSLQFKGDPNRTSSQISFTASDGDSLTPDTTEILSSPAQSAKII